LALWLWTTLHALGLFQKENEEEELRKQSP